MRDATLAIQSALRRDEGGVAIIWTPDLGMRDWLVAQSESLLPSGVVPLKTAFVAVAIEAPERPALVTPSDERAAVLELDGSRDRLLRVKRTQPLVLFLLRDGDGARALAEAAPSLASWVGGNDPDPEALADADADKEREEFFLRTQQTPEAWLDAWRADRINRTAETFALAYWAMFLESSR